MAGSIDRGGRSDVRQRRALQRLGANPLDELGLVGGDGIILDPDTNDIAVDLAPNSGLGFISDQLTIDLRDTTPGLELVASGIGVLVDTSFGLSIAAAGVRIDLAATPGLEFTGGDLRVALRTTTPGLERAATGLGVLVNTSNGLSIVAAGVQIDLATNSGLEFSSGDLRVRLNTASILTRTSTGLSSNNVFLNSGNLVVQAPTSGAVLLRDDATTTGIRVETGAFAFFDSTGDVLLWQESSGLVINIVSSGFTMYSFVDGFEFNVSASGVNLGGGSPGPSGAALAVSSGDVVVVSASSVIKVAEGSNAKMGASTMIGGTVVVSNTSVTANSRIFLTRQNSSGTLGAIGVSARTAGTSFTISSTNILDTSLVAWLIIEPA